MLFRSASVSTPVVNFNDHAAAAAYVMKHAGATALVVLGGQWPARPAGIITKADIAQAAAAGQDLNTVRLRDLRAVSRKEQAMKAIAIDGFGAPPGLHDLPSAPGAGEVLVRVRASSVTGFDVSVAHGDLKGMIEHRFPVVLGRDFAGTVEAAGPGVTSPRPGQAVFGVVTEPALGDGAFGEYVTAPVAGQHGGRAVQTTPVRAVPDSRTMDRLAADVIHGQLTVPVQRTYPLADVPPRPRRFRRGHPRQAGHQRGMTQPPSGALGIPPSRQTRPRRQGRDGPGHCLDYIAGIGQAPSTYSLSRCDPMSQITD